MKLIRTNGLGMEYHLTIVSGEENLTEIRTGDKSILVGAGIHELNQAWYNWQMKDMFVQDAFHFLTPDEREFILTGTTAEEWNEIFNEEDLND